MKFTVELPETLRGVRCDCSICAMKGAVMVGASLGDLTILEGEDKLTLYRFNSGVAKHYFCSLCGSYTFHQRRSDPNTYGVNAACLGLNPYHDFPDVAVADGVNHSLDTGTARLAGRLRFEEAPPE
ncbi:MAG: GFA family protein [Croceibacterium sp.]